MTLLPGDPGESIPGAAVPGDADPGEPYGEQVGGWVTLDTQQVISGEKTFSVLASFTAPGDNNSLSTGHWTGAMVTDDITIYPNSNISPSASMFLDNGVGQVWEFFCDSTGRFGVYDKAASQLVFTVQDSANKHDLDYSGNGVFNSLSANIIQKPTSGTYSVAYWDGLILASGATGVTLRDASEIPGRIITVKQLAASGTCTVGTVSSQTIDGAATYSLSAQYKYVTVHSDGSNWFVVASN